MMRPTRLRAIALFAGTLATGGVKADPCAQPGQWYDPDSGDTHTTAEVIEAVGDSPFILLGERHDDAEHHRWQTHTLAALHGRQPIGAVGFEMLPRAKQPALDDWVAGELRAEDFLEAADWPRVWGFDADFYLPLFHFTRMHRLPTVAMNVDRSVVRAVRERGWDALEEAEREGVSEPAGASDDYREHLRQAFRRHPGIGDAEDDEALDGFVAAQTFWDRAMAEALAKAHESNGGPVIGIVGRGHAEYGYGIPHQLADLGYEDVQVLLPHTAGDDCPEPGKADFVFALEPDTADPQPPRMGIAMEEHEDGITILDVLEGTPAEAAELRAGDRIVRAAGESIERPADMQRIVEETPPGRWLPLKITRDGKEKEKIVHFPPRGD